MFPRNCFPSFILLVSCLLPLASFSGCRTVGSSPEEPLRVCFSDHCYKVEVVSTEAARGQGLMFRSSLPKDAGMLFIFPEAGREAFWMKNMQFPIDIIWLDEDRRVVHIESDVAPCPEEPCAVYKPAGDSKFVLEVAAGESDRRKITLGQQARF